MGEAIYCLGARFRTIEEAEEAEKRAPVVLNELVEFADDLQSIRGDHSKSVKERHEELLRRHPLVSRLIPLPSAEEDDPNMNYLAGECEIYQEYRDFTLRRIETDILLDCEVWHSAEDNIAGIFYKLGAVCVECLSEEGFCDYYEHLKMLMDIGKPLICPTYSDKLTEEEFKEIDSLIVKKKLSTS